MGIVVYRPAGFVSSTVGLQDGFTGVGFGVFGFKL